MLLCLRTHKHSLCSAAEICTFTSLSSLRNHKFMHTHALRYLTISRAQDGTEMVTFLPANLAEDMHDTESMILKYEQG